MVRFNQLVDRLRHRLLSLPLLFVVLATLLTQLTLAVDDRLDGTDLPDRLQTTVDSARIILSTIAGGLIGSVALLLSLMLVAVQLAASQFSPRTLRGWIGDTTLQGAIGVVIGTVVYCLLVLRATRTVDHGLGVIPHVSVIVAVGLGIGSLIAVVRSVDHLTDRLRIGSVATNILEETVAMIDRLDYANDATSAPGASSGPKLSLRGPRRPVEGAIAIEAPTAGWVQQLDSQRILSALPDETTAYVATLVGGFVFPHAPLVWIWPDPGADHDCRGEIAASIALGDTRTMQQDIGFGIVQMVDIALRALSPGVNDPSTANDMIAHLGLVMLSLWEKPPMSRVLSEGGRTVIQNDNAHGDHLKAAFNPLRFYGAGSPQVAATIVRTLTTLRAETVRRRLPGPLEPIEDQLDQLFRAVDGGDLSDDDKFWVAECLPGTSSPTRRQCPRRDPDRHGARARPA